MIVQSTDGRGGGGGGGKEGRGQRRMKNEASVIQKATLLTFWEH